MTTTTRPQRKAPRVLLAAGLCVAVVVALTVVAGGLIEGRAGALGALVGGSIALCFFLFGSLVVAAATRRAPEASMLVALTTYALQVVLVAAAFSALGASGLVGSSLSAGWLAGGVVTATVAWTVGQLVASGRARVPVYDIDLPGGSSSASAAASGEASGPREAGAS
jgi:ATP synthase protein I